MDTEELETRIEEHIKGAEATIERARGEHDDDHLRAVVVSPAFEGVPLVEQHDMVYEALDGAVTREVHALELTTRTP